MAYEPEIRSAAKQYGIPISLIKAIIKVESNWDPKAYRAEPQIDDASYGLMQILLNTARMTSSNSSLTGRELYSPNLNIGIGTKYLRGQLDRYAGNKNDAIAAYNAGGAYKKEGGYVNQSYVDKVKKWEMFYKALEPNFMFPALTLLGVMFGSWLPTGRGIK